MYCNGPGLFGGWFPGMGWGTGGGLVVGLLGLIGLAAVLILLRGRKKKTDREGSCPHCSGAILNVYFHCPHCGKTLKSHCPGCSRVVDLGRPFCPHCSQILQENSCLEGENT
jgi:predicted amidophosphoribosyltransferase